MEGENKNPLESVNAKLADSCNQIVTLKIFGSADAVRKQLHKIQFKTLEEWTEESRATLEAKWPGICDRYNALIEEFKNGNFDDARLQEIFKEAWAMTHPK